MKLKSTYTVLLLSGQLFCHKLNIINNTSRDFIVKAYVNSVNYLERKLEPYSKMYLDAAEYYGSLLSIEKELCWHSIRAHFTYKNDSFNLMKHKQKCSDIYAIIEVDNKGNFTITRWSSAGTKYKHFNRYWKRHKEEIERRAAEMKQQKAS